MRGGKGNGSLHRDDTLCMTQLCLQCNFSLLLCLYTFLQKVLTSLDNLVLLQYSSWTMALSEQSINACSIIIPSTSKTHVQDMPKICKKLFDLNYSFNENLKVHIKVSSTAYKV